MNNLFEKFLYSPSTVGKSLSASGPTLTQKFWHYILRKSLVSSYGLKVGRDIYKLLILVYNQCQIWTFCSKNFNSCPNKANYLRGKKNRVLSPCITKEGLCLPKFCSCNEFEKLLIWLVRPGAHIFLYLHPEPAACDVFLLQQMKQTQCHK